jgi:hypothetical protein
VLQPTAADTCRISISVVSIANSPMDGVRSAAAAEAGRDETRDSPLYLRRGPIHHAYLHTWRPASCSPGCFVDSVASSRSSNPRRIRAS